MVGSEAVKDVSVESLVRKAARAIDAGDHKSADRYARLAEIQSERERSGVRLGFRP